jgi:hypothetical protein
MLEIARRQHQPTNPHCNDVTTRTGPGRLKVLRISLAQHEMKNQQCDWLWSIWLTVTAAILTDNKHGNYRQSRAMHLDTEDATQRLMLALLPLPHRTEVRTNPWLRPGPLSPTSFQCIAPFSGVGAAIACPRPREKFQPTLFTHTREI